jgi:flagellar biosynthetic protein FlhB
MESSSQDRNLPASARKLQKAADEGQVARSRDLTHLAVLGGGALLVFWLAPMAVEHLMREFAWQLHFDAHTLQDPNKPLTRMTSMAGIGLTISVVFGSLMSALVMLSSVASGGLVFSLTPLMPDFSRLNPLNGIGRLFSKEKVIEVAKMLAIAGLLFYVGYRHMLSGMETLGMLVLQPSQQALALLTQWLAEGTGWLLLVVLLIAAVDVPVQAYLHKSHLKMSHEEVKQENKESEGNPQMKGRRRQRQREIAMGASIKAVPKADFVLMNPTHYAVALKYDEQSMNAPRVISKGADLLAMRIRDLAREHNIPVLQSPVLARALYAHAEIDQEIPASLYTAVAQVLAYVYRLRAAMQGRGPMPGEVPTPFVPPELDPHARVVAAEVATP